MIFDELELTNFMSVRNAKINLKEQGLVLIQGENKDDTAFDSNGAGKSTIFEGLVNALYDRTVRGLKADDVIHEKIGKNCSQILKMHDEKGVKYQISRYRKHNEHKNNVYVFRDGKNITPKSSKDTNAFIEELIGMDYQTFVNSILFGQGLVKMFSVASDSEKKEILEKMLQMTVLKDAQDKAKEKAKEQNNEADRIQTKISENDRLSEEITLTIEQLEEREKEHASNAKEEIKTMNKAIEEAEEELEKELLEAESKDKEIKELELKKAELDKKLEKFKAYEKARDNIELGLRGLIQDRHKYERDAEELKNEVQKLKAGQGTKCIACGQEITAKTIEQSVEHTINKLRETLLHKKQVETDLVTEKGKLEKLNKALKGKEKLEEEKLAVLRELSDINGFIKSKDRILKALRDRIQSYKETIEKIKAESEKTYKPLIKEKQDKLADIGKQTEVLNKEKTEAEKKAKLYSFWIQGFGNAGIKSYLLDSVTPFLNSKANYYLGKLAGNTTEIIFSTKEKLRNGEEREKFNIQIQNRVGGGAYVKNSAGERRRIDLAISLALQDLVMSRSSSNGKINVRLYDECFDALDAVGCENVIQLLKEMEKEVGTIFVITHNDHLKPFFENQLTVVKKGGETTVKKEA